MALAHQEGKQWIAEGFRVSRVRGPQFFWGISYMTSFDLPQKTKQFRQKQDMVLLFPVAKVSSVE